MALYQVYSRRSYGEQSMYFTPAPPLLLAWPPGLLAGVEADTAGQRGVTNDMFAVIVVGGQQLQQ